MLASDIDAAGNPSEPRVLFDWPETILGYALLPTGDKFVVSLSSEDELAPPLHVIVNWRPNLRTN